MDNRAKWANVIKGLSQLLLPHLDKLAPHEKCELHLSIEDGTLQLNIYVEPSEPPVIPEQVNIDGILVPVVHKNMDGGPLGPGDLHVKNVGPDHDELFIKQNNTLLPGQIKNWALHTQDLLMPTPKPASPEDIPSMRHLLDTILPGFVDSKPAPAAPIIEAEPQKTVTARDKDGNAVLIDNSIAYEQITGKPAYPELAGKFVTVILIQKGENYATYSGKTEQEAWNKAYLENKEDIDSWVADEGDSSTLDTLEKEVRFWWEDGDGTQQIEVVKS